MPMTLGELAALVGGEVVGDADVSIAAVTSAESASPGTIVFAETDASLEAALSSDAAAVVTGREAAGEKPLIRVDVPRVAFIEILKALHPERLPRPGVHATAVVSESATVGGDVHVGPHAVVEDLAVIGDRAAIGAGSYVGGGARVGADSRIHPNVSLYPGVTLGERVVVHSGSVIGSDGFGYAETDEGKLRFPQIGTVILEDDVEVGACTTIDRGALDSTVIGAGTKIDNLVQIAHNVQIGRHCALSAQTGVAGTVKIGERVIAGGQTGIADHVTIEDGVLIGARTGVAPGKVLRSGKVYWGTPVATELKEAKRRIINIGRISKLAGRVKDLQERLKKLEGGKP